jgi:predicted RNA-binding Zn-ribbon protein involved in translation (DUF1610 family)
VARYSFRCPACGKEETRTIPIASYNTAAKQYCPCGEQLTRVFDPPLLMESGKWRDQIASIGPSAFMRREDRMSTDGG